VSDSLIEFLGARLNEAEAAAEAWLLPFSNPTPAQREHIARHDPGLVLREVATWRAILAQAAAGAPVDHPDRRGGFMAALGFVLQAKAREYSDHPDWRMDGCWGRQA
jgi:hypothetical protein